MYKICLLAALLIPMVGRTACPEYLRIWGMIDLTNKTWSTTNVSKSATPICGALPLPAEKNLEVTLTKGKKKFSTRIFQTLRGYDEGEGEDKTFAGKRFELKEVSIDTFVPDWYKGARMKITEISTNKTIVETKL